jgi:isoleucyl-tRNA synthetase
VFKNIYKTIDYRGNPAILLAHPSSEELKPMPELTKAFDPKAVDKKWAQFWEEKGLFKADPSSKKPPFSVVIPPPNVTGQLHMGHALGMTIEDAVAWN